MEEKSPKIQIQGVSDDAIRVLVNGETQTILKELEKLRELLEKQQSQIFQTGDKIYNIQNINTANFGYLMDKAGSEKSLPPHLAENLITDDNRWIESLRRELLKQGVAVGNRPLSIFQHYGWLIECFLQKMGTATGRERNLRRLSFMAEAFQSSLRYLCYIQLAQLWTNKQSSIIEEFLTLEYDAFERFDFLTCLLKTTEDLKGEGSFVPEIEAFVQDLFNPKSDLYGSALFLDQKRSALIRGQLKEDAQLDGLLDQYLTALVYWLRSISFLAKYRLVSIKDIFLNYRYGTAKNFIHLYGELHGMYSEAFGDQNDFIAYAIEEFFTYNQSVLLFKGSNVEDCLRSIHEATSYLSLSPLIIDQSVYLEKETQTPEIYYFMGKRERKYAFAQYKNELVYGDGPPRKSNKFLYVSRQNNQQPKLDELFEQMELVFQPFKTEER